MEIIDIYDVNRVKTGRTMVRGEALKPEDFRLVVHVCIFSSDGKMLIQKRQPFKRGWPDLWDVTTGGAAVTGESSQEAAQREVSEEIGLSLDLKNKRPAMTVNFENGFDDVYIIEKDVDLNTLKLQYEEVEAVAWATKEEIMGMINEGSFIPYHKGFIELLFNMRERMGEISKE